MKWLFDLFKQRRERKEVAIKALRALQEEIREKSNEYWGWDIDRDKYDACIRSIIAIDELIEYYQNEL